MLIEIGVSGVISYFLAIYIMLALADKLPRLGKRKIDYSQLCGFC